MDEQSGKSKEENVTGEGIVGLEMEKVVPE